MPFMIKQTKNSFTVQDKMKEVKPEMEEIQERYKDKKIRKLPEKNAARNDRALSKT